MKYYHYEEKGKTLGPFTIEELKQKRLKKETLVWTEGMTDWQAAENVDELKAILIAAPPPIRKEKIQTPQPSKKIDITIQNDSFVIFLGGCLLILTFSIPNIFENIAIISLTFLIIRILAVFFVKEIATYQNRNTLIWSVFAFFFPAICLIIMGILKYKVKTLDENQQKRWLITAEIKINNKQNQAAIDILKQLVDLTDSIEAKALINLEFKEYEKPKFLLNNLINEKKHLSFAYYYLGKIEEITGNTDNAISNWSKVEIDERSLYYYDQAQEKLREYQK